MTRIRRATIDDAAAAAAVYIDARHHAVPAIPPMVHGDDDVRRYWADVLLPRCDVWVATIDDASDDDAAGTDHVVAVLVMEDEWVDQLYVAPGHTGRGIGRRLLDVAKAERPGGLSLWAFQSNTGARRFYERHGFMEAERTDGADNEERSPDVRYVWNPQ